MVDSTAMAPASGSGLHKPTLIPMIVTSIAPAITAITVVSTLLAITTGVLLQRVYML